MNAKRLRLVLSAAMAAMTVYGAEGSLVSQSPNTGGSASDLDFIQAWNMFQIVADDFTLSQSENIEGVRWWGRYCQGNPLTYVANDYPFPESKFTLRVFTDNTGKPGTLVYHADTVGGAGRSLVTLGAFTGFEYEYALATPFGATAGQKYWLSIVDNTSAFPNDMYFFWSHTDQAPDWTFTHTSPGTSGWSTYSTNGMAFELLVPEPASIAILSLGVTGMLARRRSVRG